MKCPTCGHCNHCPRCEDFICEQCSGDLTPHTGPAQNFVELELAMGFEPATC
jgi:hypothetical protein